MLCSRTGMPKASGAEEPPGQREQSNGPSTMGSRGQDYPASSPGTPGPPGRARESPLLLRNRPPLWEGKLRHGAGALHQAWRVLTQTHLPGRSLLMCWGGGNRVLWGTQICALGAAQDWAQAGTQAHVDVPGGCSDAARGRGHPQQEGAQGSSAPHQHPEPARSWPQLHGTATHSSWPHSAGGSTDPKTKTP